MFLARIIRVLLWMFFMAVAVVLARRLVGWLAGRTSRTTAPPSPGKLRANPLHRDPICGAHVAGEIAHTLKHEGKLYHFCSPGCKARFLEEGSADRERSE